ncbi:MAG: SusD/RagB family nutrient-binding outer membrane lipoprotein [Chitinophagaceae bacterium]
MKKYILNILLIGVLTGMLGSCKKQLEEDYQNPETTTSGSLYKLLAGMFLNKRIHPSYWDYYTFKMLGTALFSQIGSVEPATNMYVPNTTYTEGRWTDYYDGATGTDYNYDGPGILDSYREMQTTYDELTSDEQSEQEIYLVLARIILCDQTQQMVDLWGDIPFFDAGSLNTSSRSISLAAFDDAATIYDSLDVYLTEANEFLSTVSVSDAVATQLETSDLYYGGDVDSWRMYANSLRLRLLMRESYYDESKAESEVTTILSDATTYPLITSNDYNTLLNESPSTLVADLDGAFPTPWAPAYLSDTLMNQNGDPRMDVYYDYPSDATVYTGFPSDGTATEYENNNYTVYDSATIQYNYNLPGVIFTASEVNFLKAEAYERWSLGTAATEYENGIRNSIDFYYGLNADKELNTTVSTSWSVLSTPSESTISTFLEQSAIAYSGTTTEKLAKIWTQKWVHFFVLQCGDAWAEVRRTGYPVLNFYTASNSSASQPPNRLLYTSTETVYNADNYAAVSAKDTRDTKIFWDVN